MLDLSSCYNQFSFLYQATVNLAPWARELGLETQYSPRLGDVAEPVRLDHFLCLASAHEGRLAGDFSETFCHRGKAA